MSVDEAVQRLTDCHHSLFKDDVRLVLSELERLQTENAKLVESNRINKALASDHMTLIAQDGLRDRIAELEAEVAATPATERIEISATEVGGIGCLQIIQDHPRRFDPGTYEAVTMSMLVGSGSWEDGETDR